VAAGIAALLAVVAGVLAMARPAIDVTREQERGTVILALDVSNSMLATDLEPNRLTAAIDSAERFLDEAPASTAVGLVTFANGADLVVAPVTDREPVRDALGEIDDSSTREGTAIGDAVVTSLTALRSAGVLEDPPATPQESAGRVLVITDGANSVGTDPSSAGARARAARVPVFTILLGDDPGHPRFGVPSETLSQLASQTGGVFTQTTTSEDLERVFEDIGKTLTPVQHLRELTVYFALAGLVLLCLALALLALAQPSRRRISQVRTT
jgi:Ca-activated chloride channel family protein